MSAVVKFFVEYLPTFIPPTPGLDGFSFADGQSYPIWYDVTGLPILFDTFTLETGYDGLDLQMQYVVKELPIIYDRGVP